MSFWWTQLLLICRVLDRRSHRRCPLNLLWSGRSLTRGELADGLLQLFFRLHIFSVEAFRLNLFQDAVVHSIHITEHEVFLVLKTYVLDWDSGGLLPTRATLHIEIRLHVRNLSLVRNLANSDLLVYPLLPGALLFVDEPSDHVALGRILDCTEIDHFRIQNVTHCNLRIFVLDVYTAHLLRPRPHSVLLRIICNHIVFQIDQLLNIVRRCLRVRHRLIQQLQILSNVGDWLFIWDLVAARLYSIVKLLRSELNLVWFSGLLRPDCNHVHTFILLLLATMRQQACDYCRLANCGSTIHLK